MAKSSHKWLITGGMGFIGGHLLNRIPKSDEVDIIDNMCNNSIKNEKLTHNCYLTETDFERWKCADRYECDYIIHLASHVGPAGVLQYGGHIAESIINSTMKALQIAEQKNAKLLIVSSSEVYGANPNAKPQKEEIDKIVPGKITIRLEYGIGKLMSEIVAINYAKFHDIDFNIIRPFNVIGREQSYNAGFVIPRFMKQSKENSPLTVFGNGKQVRCFTHINDVLDAMMLIMESDTKGEIFNVGNPENKITINDLADKVIKITKSKSRIEHIDPKTLYGLHYAEAWNKVPDITKIKCMLNWKPKMNLDKSLEEICIKQ